MARSIKKETHDSKRNGILDAALHLLYSRGYERMSIQDVLDELKISKGALYHYFDSKQAILDALVNRMMAEAQKVMLPVVEDPTLTAVQKMQGYLDTAVRWKSSQKELIISLMRMWYNEKNNVIRLKFAAESVPHTARIIEQVIRQGIEENVFTTRFPEQVSVLFAQVSITISDIVVGLMLSPGHGQSIPEKVSVTMDAYIDVIERMLGVSPGSLKAPSPDTFKQWFGHDLLSNPAGSAGKAKQQGGYPAI